jgi:hypothetical protein
VRPNEAQDTLGYLRKPFTSQDLLVKVKEALTLEPPESVD